MILNSFYKLILLINLISNFFKLNFIAAFPLEIFYFKDIPINLVILFIFLNIL